MSQEFHSRHASLPMRTSNHATLPNRKKGWTSVHINTTPPAPAHIEESPCLSSALSNDFIDILITGSPLLDERPLSPPARFRIKSRSSRNKLNHSRMVFSLDPRMNSGASSKPDTNAPGLLSTNVTLSSNSTWSLRSSTDACAVYRRPSYAFQRASHDKENISTFNTRLERAAVSPLKIVKKDLRRPPSTTVLKQGGCSNTAHAMWTTNYDSTTSSSSARYSTRFDSLDNVSLPAQRDLSPSASDAITIFSGDLNDENLETQGVATSDSCAVFFSKPGFGSQQLNSSWTEVENEISQICYPSSSSEQSGLDSTQLCASDTFSSVATYASSGCDGGQVVPSDHPRDSMNACVPVLVEQQVDNTEYEENTEDDKAEDFVAIFEPAPQISLPLDNLETCLDVIHPTCTPSFRLSRAGPEIILNFSMSFSSILNLSTGLLNSMSSETRGQRLSMALSNSQSTELPYLKEIVDSGSDKRRSFAVSIHGLPSDMLAILNELEGLGKLVQAHDPPRPRLAPAIIQDENDHGGNVRDVTKANVFRFTTNFGSSIDLSIAFTGANSTGSRSKGKERMVPDAVVEEKYGAIDVLTLDPFAPHRRDTSQHLQLPPALPLSLSESPSIYQIYDPIYAPEFLQGASSALIVEPALGWSSPISYGHIAEHQPSSARRATFPSRIAASDNRHLFSKTASMKRHYSDLQSRSSRKRRFSRLLVSLVPRRMSLKPRSRNSRASTGGSVARGSKRWSVSTILSVLSRRKRVQSDVYRQPVEFVKGRKGMGTRRTSRRSSFSETLRRIFYVPRSLSISE
ncbi:hypothetical protein BD410DRAFT_838494 [Rickenella mellea]|uniref:Uncharacterized protein n=1 Tax=Rickenella mellea TaxID=50990 RepID=A0A4Y7Q9I7_9AGAM|nr:hypothetical protein BD410DRAFT_838494 [Rickenella mellea]